jgi:hypothetical protein
MKALIKGYIKAYIKIFIKVFIKTFNLLLKAFKNLIDKEV